MYPISWLLLQITSEVMSPQTRLWPLLTDPEFSFIKYASTYFTGLYLARHSERCLAHALIITLLAGMPASTWTVSGPWDLINMSIISVAVNRLWVPVICQPTFEGNIETLKVKHNKIVKIISAMSAPGPDSTFEYEVPVHHNILHLVLPAAALQEGPRAQIQM